MNEDYNINLINIICKEELLIPFNDNHLIELYTDEEKIYIPLFTSVEQASGLEYTRLDKVRLNIVIRDIYSMGRYYAITINPFTDDFILNNKTIKIIENKIRN